MTDSASPRQVRVSIENLGCVKNQVDAEYLITLLQERGYRYVSDHDEADAIVVNTCGFIDPAKEESIQVTLDLRQRYPDTRIVLAGCLAQRYGEKLELPEADAIAGNRDLHAVISALDALPTPRERIFLPSGVTGELPRETLLSLPGSAYVKIAEGCDNRCSYCAIPLIRGPVVSREIDAVMDEIRGLLERGVFELNLVAQDLASFGRDRGRSELPELLRRISALKGDFWVRLLYIHPDRFPEEIISVMQADARILPYFDIPFQHASRRILSSMGRKGDAESYLALISRIRAALPDAVFRTTLLLGYPGEKRADRRAVEDFLRRGRFLWAGFFVYSPEEGTPAARRAGSLGARLSRRLAVRFKERLQLIQQRICTEELERFRSRELTVLVEEPVEGEELAIGRAYLNAPEVDGAVVLHGERLRPGVRVASKIVAVNGVDLEALPVLR